MSELSQHFIWNMAMIIADDGPLRARLGRIGVRDDNGQALAYVYFETKPCTHLAAFIEVTSPDRTIGEARTR